MRKRICFLLMLVIAATSLSGCSLTGCNKDNLRNDMGVICVGNYNGGLGYEWLQEVGRNFTQKTGIRVVIDNGKQTYNGEALMTSIKNNRQDIYFTTEVSYDDALTKNIFADITDVVKEKFETVDGVEMSIEDKMDPYLRTYFERNGSYHAIPFFSAIYGIVYDRDLFEGKKLLNLKGYTSQDGADNKPGTSDDGLPATWNDFKLLMRTMKATGVTPFTWSSMKYYRAAFMRSIWASYEGANDYMLNYSFSGEHSRLGEITPQNGYLLQTSGGKQAAIMAAFDIMENEEYYSDKAFLSSQTHVQAHEDFLYSTLEDSLPNGDTVKPIAMMIEGGWWENESRDIFDTMVGRGEQYAYGERNFGFMPFPRFEGIDGLENQTNTKTTLYSDGNSSVFINAASNKIDIAKEFLKFSTSNESLGILTRQTGVMRPYTYNMSNENFAKMTPYGKNVWEIYSDPNTELTTSYAAARIRQINSSFFNKYDFYSLIGSMPYDDPMLAINTNRGEFDYLTYYNNSVATYTKEKWEKELSSIW